MDYRSDCTIPCQDFKKLRARNKNIEALESEITKFKTEIAKLEAENKQIISLKRKITGCAMCQIRISLDKEGPKN